MPTVEIMAGRHWREINIEQLSDNRDKVTFPFNRDLIEVVKDFEGANWNPNQKYWTIARSSRNKFSLQYLTGNNPYSKYEKPIEQYTPRRSKLMSHQLEMFHFGMTYRQCILAAEQGLGKTLVAIEIMEQSGEKDWLWVGTRSTLRAVESEFIKWKSYIWPKLVTYDSLKKLVANHSGPAFKGIMFDEIQKLRNQTTQRFKAAFHITESMREEWDDPYIIGLSGTPAPQDPSNWWALIELCCPGYIKEPNSTKLKKRLALIKDEQSLIGGWYPKLVTWFDNQDKCRKCGELRDNACHDLNAMLFGQEYHEFEKSENEVEKLYFRLRNIVNIKRKKDCLDLPDKIYRIIRCTPSEETLRAAKLIVANAKNTVSAAIKLRMLSDGFQYNEVEIGKEECPLCHGRRIITHMDAEKLETCPSCDSIIQYEGLRGICIGCGLEFEQEYNENEEYECPNCNGQGEVPKLQRQAIQVPCPKEDIIKELLEEMDEVGRIVTYAGFQGSVDRCVSICNQARWETIRVDGRGWTSSLGKVSDEKMLSLFQDKSREVEKLAFVAQPDSGGLGLTLTEACMIAYYSNSYLSESRMQSEDRIHRIGLDENRGATICDLFHLPTDEKVLEVLMNNQKLQSVSLGEFAKVL